MKRVLCVAVVMLMACSFSSMAFAGGPKCPCFKDKDLEKLVKKGYFYFYSQDDNHKQVTFRTPEWDYSVKGKGEEFTFVWRDASVYEDVEDACWVGDFRGKWKGPNYWDDKSKAKGRPLETGSEDSAECAQILDDFISSTSGSFGTISLEDTVE